MTVPDVTTVVLLWLPPILFVFSVLWCVFFVVVCFFCWSRGVWCSSPQIFNAHWRPRCSLVVVSSVCKRVELRRVCCGERSNRSRENACKRGMHTLARYGTNTCEGVISKVVGLIEMEECLWIQRSLCNKMIGDQKVVAGASEKKNSENANKLLRMKKSWRI